MPIPMEIALAEPCGDCGTERGLLNTSRAKHARFAADRFGFPRGVRICRKCYEKWRYRLRTRSARNA